MSDVNHSEMPRDGYVIRLGNGPISGIAATSDGARLIVANYGHHSVSVIDTETWRVVETVVGLDEPFAIATGAHDTNRAYVSTVSPAYDSIDVIDASTNTLIATHPLALSVSDLVVSPDGRYVYASRNGAGDADVAVLDTATGQVDAIDLPTQPGAACTSPPTARPAGGSSSSPRTGGASSTRLRSVCPSATSRSAPTGPSPTWPAALPTGARWSTSSTPAPRRSPAPARSARSPAFSPG